MQNREKSKQNEQGYNEKKEEFIKIIKELLESGEQLSLEGKSNQNIEMLLSEIIRTEEINSQVQAQERKEPEYIEKIIEKDFRFQILQMIDSCKVSSPTFDNIAYLFYNGRSIKTKGLIIYVHGGPEQIITNLEDLFEFQKNQQLIKNVKEFIDEDGTLLYAPFLLYLALSGFMVACLNQTGNTRRGGILAEQSNIQSVDCKIPPQKSGYFHGINFGLQIEDILAQIKMLKNISESEIIYSKFNNKLTFDLPKTIIGHFAKKEVYYWGHSHGSLIGSQLLQGNKEGVFSDFSKIILASGSQPGDAGSSNEFPSKELSEVLNIIPKDLEYWELLKIRMNNGFKFTKEEMNNIGKNIENLKKIIIVHGGRDEVVPLKEFQNKRFPSCPRGIQVDLEDGFPKLLKEAIIENKKENILEIVIFKDLPHKLTNAPNSTSSDFILFMKILTTNNVFSN